MDLRIAKWGNSLALRIPADYARLAGIKEGDRLRASMTVDGGISIHPPNWNRQVFAAELTEPRQAMLRDDSMIGQLRRGARY